ncbi:MAG: SPFH domain-containing protein [Parcubacteria group bacterium]|jgi:hypothetical protein
MFGCKKNVCFVFTLFCLLAFSACGPVYEQDKLVLKLSSLGNRDATVANKNEQVKENTEKKPITEGTEKIDQAEKKTEVVDGDAENYQSELLTAFRSYMFFPTPGVRFLPFPKGNQAYCFSRGKSLESPKDEHFKLNAADGVISANVTVHMHVADEFPDIKDRLLKFVKTYSLTQFSNSENVLTDFMSSRFQPILYAGYQNYFSGRKVLELVRDKKGINKYMLAYMNEKYNQYGLVFTLVSVTSAMSFDEEQQERMNKIIVKEAEAVAMGIRNKQVSPLIQEIRKLELEGKDEEARLTYEANAQATERVAKAWEMRRKLVIEQIGSGNYFRWEQSKLMVDALMQKKTTVRIVPSGANLFLGGFNQAIPTITDVK